ncbi:MAG: hypothetical protein AAGF47_04330 [Planctomycetota bacterium]
MGRQIARAWAQAFCLIALTAAAGCSSPPRGAPTALIYDTAADKWHLEVDEDASELPETFIVGTQSPEGFVEGRFISDRLGDSANEYLYWVATWPYRIVWDGNRYAVKYRVQAFHRQPNSAKKDHSIIIFNDNTTQHAWNISSREMAPDV